MPDGSINASELRSCLSRVRRGDTSALNELILLASKRLESLTHLMLRDYPRVQRWAQTDDVLQNALVRLCRALESVTPKDVREFYALATTQIRRELLDLARHYSGPENAAQGTTRAAMSNRQAVATRTYAPDNHTHDLRRADRADRIPRTGCGAPGRS